MMQMLAERLGVDLAPVTIRLDDGTRVEIDGAQSLAGGAPLGLAAAEPAVGALLAAPVLAPLAHQVDRSPVAAGRRSAGASRREAPARTAASGSPRVCTACPPRWPRPRLGSREGGPRGAAPGAPAPPSPRHAHPAYANYYCSLFFPFLQVSFIFLPLLVFFQVNRGLRFWIFPWFSVFDQGTCFVVVLSIYQINGANTQ